MLINSAEPKEEESTDNWMMRLYVAGQTPKSLAAISNIQRLCNKYLAGRFQLEIVDLLIHPELAEGDNIIAVPTLVRKRPGPIRKIIGNISDTDKTLVALQIDAVYSN